MDELKKTLSLAPVCYVARDIERALGLSGRFQNYYIITNVSPLSKSLAKKNRNILIVKNRMPLDTRELLKHPRTKKFLKQK
jgi:hypothetical protein